MIVNLCVASSDALLISARWSFNFPICSSNFLFPAAFISYLKTSDGPNSSSFLSLSSFTCLVSFSSFILIAVAIFVTLLPFASLLPLSSLSPLPPPLLYFLLRCRNVLFRKFRGFLCLNVRFTFFNPLFLFLFTLCV